MERRLIFTRFPAPAPEACPVQLTHGPAPRLLSFVSTIRFQILLAFLVLATIVGVVGLHASYRIARGGQLVTETYDGALMSISYSRAAAADFALMQNIALRVSMEPDADARGKLEQRLQAMKQALSEDLGVASERAMSDRARQSAGRARAAVEDWDSERRALADASPGRASERLAMLVHAADREMELLVNYTAGDGFAYRQHSRAAVAEDWWLNIGALVSALVFSAVVTWLLARHITREIAVASAVAGQIAQGQLDSPIPDGGRDELGNLLRSLAVMRENLQVMVKREVSLRQSAQGRLLDAIESSHEGIVVVGHDRTVVLANDQALAMLGWRDRPHGTRASASAGSGGAGIAWADLAANLPSPDVQGEVRMPGGRWISLGCSPTREGGFVAVISDITFNKEQSAWMAAVNLRLDTALASMSQGLCLFDAEGRLMVVNARYSELFGLPEGAVRPGLTLEEVMQLRIGRDNHGNASAADLLARKRAAIKSRQPTAFNMTLADGRVLAVVLRPAPNGGFAISYEDVTDRCLAEQKVVFMARHDALTGLPNRTLFAERIHSALSNATTERKTPVLFLDLDRFKTINDTLGHAAGDLLLTKMAERLKRCLRPEDMISRVGGDEFTVVLSDGPSREQTIALAQRIIEAANQPFDLDGQRATVGVSVGIAVAPGDGSSPDVLLRNADMALYRAKAEGRGTWRFYQPEMDASIRSRRLMGIALREALANNEMQLRYQPIYDLRNDRVRGFEALLRWRNREFGDVAPSEFIPLAEELGLMVSIGRWVLNRACGDAAGWADGLSLSVNVSPAQLSDERFIQTVTETLEQTKLVASRLNLELTETVLLTKNAANMATLTALRAQGIQTSLDDFGVGYSSLSYLVNFPMDQIKIDKTFVQNLVHSDTRTVAQAIIRLAHNLSLRVVAEGVETEEQLTWLRNEGCDDIQGYLVARPSRLSEVNGISNWHLGDPARQIAAV
jgi:diguanylate cyclase (GGDEF)-like protein